MLSWNARFCFTWQCERREAERGRSWRVEGHCGLFMDSHEHVKEFQITHKSVQNSFDFMHSHEHIEETFCLEMHVFFMDASDAKRSVAVLGTWKDIVGCSWPLTSMFRR